MNNRSMIISNHATESNTNRGLASLLGLLFGLLMIFQGCDLYPQNDYQEYYVVESYLVANQNLPVVRLSRTLPIDEAYSFEEAAISNASIVIRLLDQNGNPEQTTSYQGRSQGLYLPEDAVTVLPGRRYQLEVTFPGNDEVIRSETLVPGTFETVSIADDSVAYQSERQITVTTTRSSYPGRQSYFVFSVRSENPSLGELTPFYLDIVSKGDEDLSDFTLNSSGIINEDNYEQNPDNTLTLKVPWLAIAFYGENEIIANAIDDNLYDFLRSQEVQTGDGPSTLPPGEIQNIIYNIEGGIGIFGSMARTSNTVYVGRPQR